MVHTRAHGIGLEPSCTCEGCREAFKILLSITGGIAGRVMQDVPAIDPDQAMQVAVARMVEFAVRLLLQGFDSEAQGRAALDGLMQDLHAKALGPMAPAPSRVQ